VHARRCQSNAVLVILDFFWNANLHFFSYAKVSKFWQKIRFDSFKTNKLQFIK